LRVRQAPIPIAGEPGAASHLQSLSARPESLTEIMEPMRLQARIPGASF
jgi:hypothetical protein